ncbi:hypothetical protein G6M89_04765 [Natronolimnobius sp. AArcel1]|uniref:hypothetical protein n=1 Tax=Natronolimnobius sp. AArcel1 TaxID=1679093 RepID=UPI0013EDF61C|nr:hypothetical protein [Natronolimnobius sp. AArcel1]NGM68327.1 hypothetical protein [Natronolimnobius sp. AArcel1]
MTRTIRTLRTTAGSMLAEIGAAVGTFVALTWLAGHLVTASSHFLTWSAADTRVPDVGVWIAVLTATAVGTIWLEHGGYRRLSAKPNAGRAFAWLGVCYLPVVFLPAGYALWLAIDGPAVAVNLYLIGCVVCASWLAFYGGLERLQLRTAQFSWAFLVVFCGLLTVVGLGSLLPLSAGLETVFGPWILESTALGVGAVCVQLIALQVGFGETVGPSATN